MCPSTENVRLYGVCVDREPLRMQLPLCQEHGDRYLFLVGKLAGEMLRDSPKQDRSSS
jgi:hypothetical protein